MTLRGFPDSLGMSALVWDTSRGYIYAGSRVTWWMWPSLPPGIGGVWRARLQPTGMNHPPSVQPAAFALCQNYPNPFNPTTTISYDLPVRSFVTLKVFDLLGREIRTLVEEEQDGGFRNVIFDAGDLPSGVYIYRLQPFPLGGGFPREVVEFRKMLLVK